MSEIPPACSDIESQFQRIYKATGCKTQSELAGLLGIRQSSVAVAKRQRRIPDKWLVKLYQLGISPEWIAAGTTESPMDIAQPTKPLSKKPNRPPDKAVLQNILYCIPSEDLLAEIQRRNLVCNQGLNIKTVEI